MIQDGTSSLPDAARDTISASAAAGLEQPDKIDTSETSTSALAHHDYHFYLHKPQTSSTSRVIIPLSPASTFSTCLAGRTILEYPTIYVLKEPPEAVPQPFQLEVDYKRDEKKLIEELDEHERVLGPATGGAQEASAFADGEGMINDSSVLDSLERDLAHVKELMES